MKKIRQITQNPFILAFLLIAFLNVSCNQDDLVDSNNPVNSKQYTDIDVFKGVMFLEGPVADKLDDFKELNFKYFAENQSDIDRMQNYQNTLVSYIESSNPNYFSEFRKEIGSGDFYRVKETVSNAALLIKDKTIEMSGLDESEVESLQKSITEKLSTSHDFNKKLSKEDIQSIVKDMQDYTSQSNRDKASPVGIDLWILIYGAAVVAAVVVLLALWVNPPSPSDPIPSSSSKNNYYSENLQSEITIQLEGI